jgi:hypothetical protein
MSLCVGWLRAQVGPETAKKIIYQEIFVTDLWPPKLARCTSVVDLNPQ